MSYLDERRKHIEDGRPLPPKKKYQLAPKSAKRILKEKEQGTIIIKPKKAGWFDADKVDDKLGKYYNEDTEMKAFWKDGEDDIRKGLYKCWECGDVIVKSDFRNSTGHIFPKSLFPSVSSNKWNKVIVGARCGCHNKTHRLDTFSQMKIFPTAVNRFLKFADLITEKHKYLNQFIEYANATI